MEIIQCPKCSSQEVEIVSNGTFKCKACGAVFISDGNGKESGNSNAYTRKANAKSNVAAGILGIFLGGLGIHKFYMGKVGMGILYLLFCWTMIPGIVGFIEGIIYLCESEEQFNEKHIKA